MKTRRSGFTLVEALVSLAIFAVIALLCYGSIDKLRVARDHLAAEAASHKMSVRLFSRIENDIRNAAPRPITGPLGEVHPPFFAAGDGSFFLTRFPNPWTPPEHHGMRRIGYRLDQGSLWYLVWPNLDAAPGDQPQRFEVAKGVDELTVKFMGNDTLWRSAWTDIPLPHVVKIVISFRNGEEYTRLVAVNAILDQTTPS